MDTEVQTEQAELDDIQSDGGESIEDQARVRGWVPKDEWEGDPDKWCDAETFVERGREFNNVLKNENAALRKELKELTRELKKRFSNMEAAERRGYESALADLEARRIQAVEDGDVASFQKIDKEVAKLQKEVGTEPDQADIAKRAQEAFIDFRENNPWYDRANLASASETDREARIYADLLADKWTKQGRHLELDPDEFMTEIAAETKKKFPALGLRKKPASDVSAPTANRGPRGRTFADLPPEAKAMADKLVKKGILPDRAAYVKTYDWS